MQKEEADTYIEMSIIFSQLSSHSVQVRLTLDSKKGNTLRFTVKVL